MKMTKLTVTKIAAMVLVALTLTAGVEANAAELSAPATVSVITEASDYVCAIAKDNSECRVVIADVVEAEDTTEVVVESECTFVQFLFNGITKIFQGEIEFGEFINDVRSW